jgi:radical SAM protein with 4Fe4S-binding SPASM domain
LLKNINDKTELITLAGLGEPLLNPEIVAMVYECKRRGFKSLLYTNATLLNKEISMRLLEAGLSGILISFDGPDENTYEYYRKGAGFSEVKNNIMSFLELKKNLDKAVFVEIQMIDFEDSPSGRELFRKTWGISGIDSVRIKKDQMRVGKIEPPEKAYPTLGVKKLLCSMPWRGPATVNVYGDVYPCCVGSKSNIILGNIFSSTLEEVWNSASANKLRMNFVAKGQKLSSCKECYIPLPPVVLCGMGALLGPFLIYKIYAKIESIFFTNA